MAAEAGAPAAEAAAATAAATAPPQPTFNWIGPGTVSAENSCIYFDSFQFCNTVYVIGDHVYLLPEDEGSPLYIARILRAFEDPSAPDSDRLCIEVGVWGWVAGFGGGW